MIDRLSADLRERFPGATGFSPRNLKYMRALARAWPDREVIVQQPVAQLPWGHHILLLQKLKLADQRLWYAHAAVDEGWSRNVLFVGAADVVRERDLERALIEHVEHVEKFLLELGQGFTSSLPAELESSLPTVAEIEAEFASELGDAP